MDLKINIGTRGSQLALWQARSIASMLHDRGIEPNIVVIETQGDKQLNKPFAEIGSKGIFTQELEIQLISGKIDIAVHSAKDMQSTLPEGLEIIAFAKREEPHDVLVSFNRNLKLSDSSGYLIGTSSARRKALMKLYFPHIKTVEARGNLQTRIRKMQEGHYDAMILAYAGIHRMDYDSLIIEKLQLDQFIPAVGQGSIAVEASSAIDPDKRSLLKTILNHEDSEYCIVAERSFLRTLEGGCSIPIFGLAEITGDTLTLNAGVVNAGGTKILKEVIRGKKQDADEIGNTLADIILAKGGREILKDIKLNP
jgi:hydroxymethylbilane synthase